ncbi:MAG: hypothetical protein AB7P34_04445 [Vicinamibacterales bacterium]
MSKPTTAGKSGQAREQVHVRLRREDVAFLRQLARANGLSMSATVQILVRRLRTKATASVVPNGEIKVPEWY